MSNETTIPKSDDSDLPLRLMLSFNGPEYERRFLTHYVDSYFRYAQISLIVGLFLISEDFLVDWFANPDVKANFYRITLVLPLYAPFVLYTLLPQAKKYWHLAMSAAIFSVGTCLFWALLAVDFDGGKGLRSWVGIMDFTYVEFYCFIILGIRFSYALIPGSLLLLSFLAMLWIGYGHEAFYWVFHTVNMFLLAAGIGWWREWLIRKDYAMHTALDEARREAEALAHIKSQFLANMSHEIRTPLNGILGLAQIGYRDNRGRQTQSTYARILDSGRLLLKIVNEILDFSKVEAGKMQVETVPLSLDRVLSEAVAPIQEQACAKALTLNVEQAPDLPTACLGDPLRLTQILLNLLSNAVKFTEQGHVTLYAGRVDKKLVFRVSDTGIGMTAAQLAQVFAPFQQGDSSATRKYGGTGLGLAICRSLAELLGGEIRAESRPGGGSTFELQLPYVATSATGTIPAAADRAPDSCGPRLCGLEVLAAEDVEVNQIILADLLRAEGAQVVMVENGRQAVEAVRQRGPDAFDIVLMDIQMREMDGLEATRRILEFAPQLPILGHTAHVLEEELRKSLAAGMLDHVGKPIDGEELVAKVLRHARHQPTATLHASTADAVPDTPQSRAARLKEAILQQESGTPAKLRTAAAAGDMDEMIFLAHSTYNTALAVKDRALQLLAKNAEHAVRGALPEAMDHCLELAQAIEIWIAKLSDGDGMLAETTGEGA